jgi:DNA polymerase-3 subunit beta
MPFDLNVKKEGLLNFSIQRETLLQTLQISVGVVERRHTMQILSNVLLAVDDRQLIVIGTDLEVELIGLAKLDKPIKNFRPTTVAARKLMDICRALPEESILKITASEDGKKIGIASGRSRFMLATLPAADFPRIPEQTNLVQFSIRQDVLKKLAEKTYFAIPQQDVRNYLNGMLLEIQDSFIRVVASDGHRLALNMEEFPAGKSDTFAQVIIPRKGVLELMRLLENSKDQVVVELNANYLRLKGESFIFTSKLIAGKFPNYARSIPKNINKQIIINRQDLKQAIMRVAILSNEIFRSVKFNIENGLLKLSTNNPEQEEAGEEMEVDYKGDQIEIMFNINYLLDILSSISSDKIVLNIKDGEGGVVIEDFDERNKSLYVVMPIRK